MLRSVPLYSSDGKGGLIADLKHWVPLWMALNPSFGHIISVCCLGTRSPSS